MNQVNVPRHKQKDFKYNWKHRQIGITPDALPPDQRLFSFNVPRSQIKRYYRSTDVRYADFLVPSELAKVAVKQHAKETKLERKAEGR